MTADHSKKTAYATTLAVKSIPNPRKIAKWNTTAVAQNSLVARGDAMAITKPTSNRSVR